MSFRINFCRVPKGFKFNGDLEELDRCKEYILSNSATIIYEDSSNENNRLFTLSEKEYNNIDNCPIAVATVSKEQLYQFIVEMRLRIIDDLNVTISTQDDTCGNIMKYRRWTNATKSKKLSFELNTSEESDIEKMLVTDSSTFEYQIFNFISIYKNLDFEKYQLIIYGY